MGVVKLLVTCPICKDPHLGIRARKPTLLTPSTTSVVCDECQSSTTFRIEVPRNRESKNQVLVTPLTFNLSQKMVTRFKEEIEKKKAESTTPTEGKEDEVQSR